MSIKVILPYLLAFLPLICFSEDVDSLQLRIDEIENSLVYQTGKIEFSESQAYLTVPEGYRFLDKKQSFYVLTDLWGNPPDSTVLGLLVPNHLGVLSDNVWVFTIEYDPIGYVEDDDAEDIDYDELLESMQKDTREQNPYREKEGYSAIELIGWASRPYYDKEKRVLHWAKELQFGEDSLHTLNYNLRVLGRKGVFVLNAVADMTSLPAVKSDINQILGSVQFEQGSKYSDFDPDIDEVAAWSIGGLVAGKMLAKAGFFTILLKFWKLIFLAVAGAGATIWKFISGKNKEA